MDLHRVAVITTLQQQGIAPEPSDLVLVWLPLRDMRCKDRAEYGVRPYAGVELVYDPLDLFRGDGDARGHGHTMTSHTKIRLTTR